MLLEILGDEEETQHLATLHGVASLGIVSIMVTDIHLLQSVQGA